MAKGITELVNDFKILHPMAYQKIYNKAIDDFIKEVDCHTQENWIDHLEYGITFSDLEKVAEKLKGGAK